MRGNVHVRFGGEARETRPLKGGRCALVLTLHLLFAPTLIFYEIVFNLGTQMQAAARSYRLNQTHAHCKVVYLYAEGTMEQTAVQLMSRKQRAAKLLTGEVGLTGLDALTEGEGGFEQALLDAIGRDEALVNPAELFKADGAGGELDAEDAAYWNVERTDGPSEELLVVEAQPIAVSIVPAPVPESAKVDWLAQRLTNRKTARRSSSRRDPLYVPADWFADEAVVRPPTKPEPIPVQLALF